MSSHSDIPFLDDELNPYSAPKAELKSTPGVLEGVQRAEEIRRAHIKHEAAVKSIGSLYYLGCVFSILSCVISAFQLANGQAQGAGELGAAGPMINLIVNVFATALNGALGYGLQHLQQWARWTAVALVSIGLLGIVIGCAILLLVSPGFAAGMFVVAGGISSYILYLLLAPKAGVIFSPEYKRVIELTPNIVHKTSLILKIFLAILVLILVIAVIGALSK
jgi:hypothetical protein